MGVQDVERCIAETRVDGVMTAEGNLYNPYLFEGRLPVTWEVAYEYLTLADEYYVPSSYIRGHLFKIFHHLFNMKANATEREAVAIGHTVSEFRDAVKGVEAKYRPIHEGMIPYVCDDAVEINYNIPIPPWLCHSYVRPPPECHMQKMEEHAKINENPELQRKCFDEFGNQISRKLMKKLRRIKRRPIRPEGRHERGMDLCEICSNPTVGLNFDIFNLAPFFNMNFFLKFRD